jgi:hypothetical protein
VGAPNVADNLGKCPQAQSALERKLVEADESWRFNTDIQELCSESVTRIFFRTDVLLVSGLPNFTTADTILE